MTDRYGEHPFDKTGIGAGVVAAEHERGFLGVGIENISGERALGFVTETLQRWTGRQDPLEQNAYDD